MFGAPFLGTRISKRIEVLNDLHEPYYVSVEKAKALTASKQAKFLNSRQIKMSPSESKRGIWAVVGRAAIYSDGVAIGPKFGVLQLT